MSGELETVRGVSEGNVLSLVNIQTHTDRHLLTRSTISSARTSELRIRTAVQLISEVHTVNYSVASLVRQNAEAVVAADAMLSFTVCTYTKSIGL